ncbi:MAG: UDP-N-acetylmuramoyl-L-alanyl-D-glutamate--2,6-diaminopimelate ligase [Ruminococcaceae bacterium]|nr:UDP-N-acetylmuramoyl-L-alanyl-D-glutamate--2,6-diaminopimelate ligase [Oscillospiraceae bacterium]
MLLSELFVGTDIKTDKKIETCAVVYDSRKVVTGSVFVAIKGDNTNGEEYAFEAEKNGAVAYVGENLIDGLEIPQFITINARRTLAFMCANFYGNPQNKLRVIGVTGTNGKTSTAFLLKTVIAHGGYKVALCGTVKCMIGEEEYIPKLCKDSEINFQTMTTPDPDVLYMLMRDMVEDGVEVLVMETSSHALALEKLAPIQFEIGIFTNLTEEHLDFHKSMDNYLLAKAKLFSQCKKGIFNIDDAYAQRVMDASRCEKITYGIKNRGDYFAESIVTKTVYGSEYILHSANSRFKIKTQIPGDFTLYNTLATAAAAREFSINLITVQNAIYSLNGICGRLERVKLGFEGNGISVFIDYAHTPFALHSLLSCVSGFRERDQRIVTLFGCGGDRDKDKRAVMGRIAVEESDFVIITSDNSRSENPSDIIEDILQGVGNANNYIVIENRCKAIEYVIENAMAGDIILLVGKGHEQYEIDKDGMHPFSEIEIVENAVKKRR